MSTGRVFELTKALGNALKETDEYQAMRLAERRVYERPEISKQLEKYNALADLVEQEMEKSTPDMNSVAAWSEEQEILGEELQRFSEVGKMLQAKEDFSKIIYQMNSMLQFIVTGEPPAEKCSSLDCSDCSFCDVEL